MVGSGCDGDMPQVCREVVLDEAEVVVVVVEVVVRAVCARRMRGRALEWIDDEEDAEDDDEEAELDERAL